MGLNKTQLAAHLGLTDDAIRKWIRAGRLEGARESDGSFDPVRARVAMEAGRKQKPGPGRPPKAPDTDPAPGTDPKPRKKTLWDLQADHERVKIAERKLKVRRQKADVVNRAAVVRELFGRTRRLRDAIMAQPSELAPLIRALPQPLELRPLLDLLERYQRAFCERMAQELAQDVRPNRGAA